MMKIWISVIFLVLPWMIWLILRKKESTGRLLLAGFFTASIKIFFDSMGVLFGLWHYNLPPSHHYHTFYIPWGFSIIPVTTMLLIQFKPKGSPYLKAILFSLFTVFVVEPLFHWLDIFEPVRWEYYFGLPFFFIYYLLAYKVSKIDTFADLS
ncbi:CBO0543 family protein [Clostridium formicaceticum]|uniref:Lycopene cyclase domain-containing protein n=2 Tax=Clostridium formicaceticum TaxID=1497 RepID=A0ABN4TGC7_9CLOT|nr:CBO0543 family protein [Clostridium formicaceticum]AOY77920.1 hypothetical protein BJL90_19885 [Clostridium formicaceticum]